jgi:hypothetical protein
MEVGWSISVEYIYFVIDTVCQPNTSLMSLSVRYGLFLFFSPPLTLGYCTIPQKKAMVFKGQDAWRSHPLFQGLWKSPFPGFRNAVLIFGVYMIVDYGLKSMKPKAAQIAHH